MAAINSQEILNDDFLHGMYKDGYFPDFLVDKIKNILLEVCSQIEEKKPSFHDEIFAITHTAVEKINHLEEVFEENDSELETEVREVLGADFDFIVNAYGFNEVDIEDVIAPREC